MIPRPLALFVLVLALGRATPAAPEQVYRDGPFPQVEAVHFRNRVDLKGLELRTIRVDRDGKILVNTNRGLLKAEDGRLLRWQEYAGLSDLDHYDLELLEGKFVFLTDRMLLPLHRAGVDYRHNPEGSWRQVAPASPGHYLLLSASHIVELHETEMRQAAHERYASVLFDPYDRSFVLYASDRLARYVDGRVTALPVPPAPVTAVAVVGKDRLRVATTDGLFALDGGTLSPVRTPLPVRRLTSVAADSAGRLWVGSERGLFSLDERGGVQYYAGRRWLAGDHVIDVFVDRRDDVYVLTTAGVSQLRFASMTLAEKADRYLRNLRLHHIRFGLVSEVRLKDGDYAQGRLHDSDNDGLWSGIYVAAEAFRYAVTKERDALENARDGLDALERLVTISTIPGFQARTFELRGFKQSDPERWRDRPQGDFEWKGHTSSDEIVGTFFAYSVLDQTLGKDDRAARRRIAAIVAAVMDHIIDHRYYLVDVDGRPTLWGRWNPEYVNGPPPFPGDRRLNSIEILSFLQLAYALTGDNRYVHHFYELVQKHGYAENAVRYLPDPMGPWNHSDDELYWLSYYNLIGRCFDPQLREVFLRSAREHYEATRRKRNPLWNLIYGAVTGRKIDLEGVARVLREFPLDRRDWRMENSHRLDVRISRRPGVGPETVEPLSPAVRCVHKWNANEMEPDGGGDGNSPESGAEYLLPYWMGRYYGYISAPTR